MIAASLGVPVAVQPPARKGLCHDVPLTYKPNSTSANERTTNCHRRQSSLVPVQLRASQPRNEPFTCALCPSFDLHDGPYPLFRLPDAETVGQHLLLPREASQTNPPRRTAAPSPQPELLHASLLAQNAASRRGPSSMASPALNFITFNQDHSCLAVGMSPARKRPGRLGLYPCRNARPLN